MAVGTFTIEATLAAPGVAVELTNCEWSEPVEAELRTERYALAMLLTPGLPHALGSYHTDSVSGAAVEVGPLVFVPYDVHFHSRASGGSTRHVACHFERSWFEELTGLGQDWNPALLTASLNIRNERLVQALTRLAQEALAPGFASDRLVEGMGTLVAVELARHLRSVDARSSSTVQTLSPWQMHRLTRYFESTSGYAPDIERMGQLCGIGTRHFRRLFKQTTDQSIQGYARTIWAAKAKALLSDTDLTLKEIWSELGFSNPSSFSKAFRKAAGQSPRAFRQQFGRQQPARRPV